MSIPIYRNFDGENIIVLNSFCVHNCIYYAVLNLLDESLADNDLIRLPCIQGWTEKQINNLLFHMFISEERFQQLFSEAYHRRQDWISDRYWTHDQKQHLNALLEYAIGTSQYILPNSKSYGVVTTCNSPD